MHEHLPDFLGQVEFRKPLITPDDSMKEARKKALAELLKKTATGTARIPGTLTKKLGQVTSAMLDEGNDGRTIQGINADDD
jgi:hypothetical protein